jgi:HK97 family phage prohead protease
MKRAQFTDDSINRYGFRVLTSGGKLDGFKKNPVMLFNHDRWARDYAGPIGKWTDLKVENGTISGLPDFDLDDDYAKKVANKWDKGFLNATSIGFTPLKISNDPKDMLPGQRFGTVTEWELKEVSIVDIPANKNALKLYDADGKEINLEDESELMKLGFAPANPMDNQIKNKMKINFKAAQTFLLSFFNLSIPDGKDSVEKELTDQEVTELNDKLATLSQKETEIGNLNTQLSNVNAKLADAEAKLGTAQSTLSQKDTEIQQLKDRVVELEKKSVPPSGSQGNAGNEDGKELGWMEDPKQKNLSFNQQALELLKGL